MSEFMKGIDWSKFSYREIQNELAAVRSAYIEKYIREQVTDNNGKK